MYISPSSFQGFPTPFYLITCKNGIASQALLELRLKLLTCKTESLGMRPGLIILFCAFYMYLQHVDSDVDSDDFPDISVKSKKR